MGGWDYGMDLWGGRVGLWAGVGSGEELGKRPEMKEVEIGFDDPAVGSSVNGWKVGYVLRLLKNPSLIHLGSSR